MIDNARCIFDRLREPGIQPERPSIRAAVALPLLQSAGTRHSRSFHEVTASFAHCSNSELRARFRTEDFLNARECQYKRVSPTCRFPQLLSLAHSSQPFSLPPKFRCRLVSTYRCTMSNYADIDFLACLVFNSFTLSTLRHFFLLHTLRPSHSPFKSIRIFIMYASKAIIALAVVAAAAPALGNS